jgi:O-antigen/teichoic acid export membrane protein
MLKTVKKLGRLSVIYALGDILNKGLAFLLLPLYTRFLTPDDYGILAITTMISAFLNMLLSFGMMSAILRFYYLFTDDVQRRRFYGAMWVFLLLLPGCVVLVLSQFGQPIFFALFRQVPFEPYIRLTLWTVFLRTAFALMPPTLFRAREQAGHYAAFSFLTFATTALLTLWFVVIQRQGVVGAVRAQCAAALVVAVISLAILLKEVIPNTDWRHLRPALAYSVPLIPHFVSHWGLSVSDRAILERYVSLGQLGIYSLGYQFGTAYQMVMTAVNNSLLPMFGRSAKDDKEFRLIPSVATYYVLVITTIGLAVAVLAGDIIVLLTPLSYHSAGKVVPWVILGYLMMGIYYLPMNVLSITAGETKAVPFVTMAGATVNIGMNLLLVPKFGIMAAAVNTVLGYAVLAVLMFVLAQRTQPIDYEYSRLGKIFFSGALLFALGQLLMQFTALINVGIGLFLVVLLPLVLNLLGFWTEKEKQFIAKMRRDFIFQVDIVR